LGGFVTHGVTQRRERASGISWFSLQGNLQASNIHLHAARTDVTLDGARRSHIHAGAPDNPTVRPRSLLTTPRV